MLAECFEKIAKYFEVTFFNYNRPSTGVLLSSGCGIGMALMDVCPQLNWFLDVDTYRFKQVDWESIAVIISARKPTLVVTAGWFTIDTPKALNEFKKGVIETKLVEYAGGGSKTLSDLIGEIHG